MALLPFHTTDHDHVVVEVLRQVAEAEVQDVLLRAQRRRQGPAPVLLRAVPTTAALAAVCSSAHFSSAAPPLEIRQNRPELSYGKARETHQSPAADLRQG